MKPVTAALLFVVLISTVPAVATPYQDRQQIIDKLIMEGPFSNHWKLPSNFTLTRLQKLIGQFSEQVRGKGFRFLGDANDADHGHILFRLADEETDHPRLESFAILYHTQEQAYSAYWHQTLPERYSYIDVRSRNWLQWLDPNPLLDGEVIDNAREYADPNEEDIEIYYREAPPQQGEHYTIHGRNLSFDKLEAEIVAELQFRFNKVTCSKLDLIDMANRRIRIPSNSDAPDICLAITTNTSILSKDWYD